MLCRCLIHSLLKELKTEVGTPIHSTDHKVLPPCHLGRGIAHAAVHLGGLSVSTLVWRLFCRCVSSILAMTLCLTCISYRYFVSPPHFWYVRTIHMRLSFLSLPVFNLCQLTWIINTLTLGGLFVFLLVLCFPFCITLPARVQMKPDCGLGMPILSGTCLVLHVVNERCYSVLPSLQWADHLLTFKD